MSAVGATSAITGDSSTGVLGTGSDLLGKQEFLKILVTQLRNQDPLNPVEDKEFIGQMAQLSTLEATTNLGTEVKGLVLAQQQMQSMLLVGRTVEFVDESGVSSHGAVSGVRLDTLPPALVIGDREVPITFVQTVL